MIELLFLWSIMAKASGPCDQKIYDQLWLRVLSYRVAENIEVLNAINHGTKLDVQNDPPDFEILRKLCNGQKSSYEKEK